MTSLAWLIPAALTLAGLGLVAFLWALHSGQFEDLDGAAYRALEDEPPDDDAEHCDCKAGLEIPPNCSRTHRLVSALP